MAWWGRAFYGLDRSLCTVFGTFGWMVVAGLTPLLGASLPLWLSDGPARICESPIKKRLVRACETA